MKKAFFATGMLLLCSLAFFTAKATHIYGGELLYTYVSGNTYKVSLVMYGDCSGASFPNLDTAKPQVSLYNGFTNSGPAIILAKEAGYGQEVSPVCDKEAGNTSCKNPTNPLPGVMKYVYSKTVNIPTPSAGWRFVFTGNMGGNSLAGRSTAITNISGSNNGSIMYLEARLNNLNGHNSSPNYTSIPTPYFCINRPQQYNQGAVDPDNDSLSFSLTSALTGQAGTPTNIAYIPPYTATEPLAAAQNTFSYNAVNGQMGFTPDQVQSSLVVNKVEEYKNGVLVGSSMREMTFVVLNNCNNTPPQSGLDKAQITGGKHEGDNIVNVCQGTPFININIPISDPEGDAVNVDAPSIPAGSSLNVANNNTANPTVIFSWNTSNIPLGTYNFYINYKDNGCPLTSNQTTAYTIRIVQPPSLTYEPVYGTGCYHKQFLHLNVTNGVLPYAVTIKRDGITISNHLDTTGIIKDSLVAGNYTAYITSPNLSECVTSLDFTVVDSGTYPVKPFFIPPHYCVNELAPALTVRTANNAILHWFTTEGTPLEVAPTFDTKQPRVFYWLVSQQYKVCESLTDTVKVYVHENPDVHILNQPEKLCMGDRIYLRATGAESYHWEPKDKVDIEADSSYSSRVMESTMYVLTSTNSYGCHDTDYVLYDQVEQCCRFFYPTAFTPNMDGKNDGFRVRMYGNPESYRLTIYNRWGQVVFTTDDPNKYWDGNFGGRSCDPGVYFYKVRGKCLTGHVEEAKGEISLLR